MKLSVMMITYNHEDFIAQALNSVLDQRVNFDYEIVIGEDCSTDRTREILLDFQQKYPTRIKAVLRDKNIGAIKNMGATLSACHGNYVALLEGDDYWIDEYKLQKQINFLDNHPGSAMCCHRVRFLDPEKREGIEIHPLHTGNAVVGLFQFAAPRSLRILRKSLALALGGFADKLAIEPKLVPQQVISGSGRAWTEAIA